MTQVNISKDAGHAVAPKAAAQSPAERKRAVHRLDRWVAGSLAVAAGIVGYCALSASNLPPDAQPGVSASAFAHVASVVSRAGQLASVGPASSFGLTEPAKISAAWTGQADLRRAVLGERAAAQMESDNNLNFSEIAQNTIRFVTGGHFYAGEAALNASQFAPDVQPPVIKYGKMPQKMDLTMDQARLCAMDALAQRAMSQSSYIYLSAIPGGDKSLTHLAQPEKEKASYARSRAAAAFRKGFIEASVALLPEGQARSLGVPTAETLKASGFTPIDPQTAKAMDARLPKEAKALGPFEKALIYASAAARVEYKQSYSGYSLSKRQAVAPHGRMIVTLYPTQEADERQELLSSPGAVAKASLAMRSIGDKIEPLKAAPHSQGWRGVIGLENFREGKVSFQEQQAKDMSALESEKAKPSNPKGL